MSHKILCIETTIYDASYWVDHYSKRAPPVEIIRVPTTHSTDTLHRWVKSYTELSLVVVGCLSQGDLRRCPQMVEDVLRWVHFVRATGFEGTIIGVAAPNCRSRLLQAGANLWVPHSGWPGTHAVLRELVRVLLTELEQ